MKSFIPPHKDDFDAVSLLEEASWEEIQPHIKAILEWLASLQHWPMNGHNIQANAIASGYFKTDNTKNYRMILLERKPLLREFLQDVGVNPKN